MIRMNHYTRIMIYEDSKLLKHFRVTKSTDARDVLYNENSSFKTSYDQLNVSELKLIL